MTGSSPDLSVEIAGIRMKNPVMSASGTLGYGTEYEPYLDLSALGAMVTKAVTLEPREGNRPPRVRETPAGMLNAIGLQNPGAEAFIEEKLPEMRRFGVPVIANISGRSIEEFATLAEMLSVEGVDGLEVNISCPNVEEEGMYFGVDCELTGELTAAVVAATELPVIVKLSPNVTDICAIARAATEAGADALSLVNTLVGMSIDVEARRPHLGNITGGLSGPAIRPVAVRMVWEVAREVDIPIIGMGGIMAAGHALEFILAGATAVAVGTANFVEPATMQQVIDGLASYCRRHGVSRITELVGALEID
ncbi:MAG: dihydroorotate dehydrogenase [Armatimonadota bacterium]|nr:dihydroorotate dehydrogenase [Armatimonadota bacterium]